MGGLQVWKHMVKIERTDCLFHTSLLEVSIFTGKVPHGPYPSYRIQDDSGSVWNHTPSFSQTHVWKRVYDGIWWYMMVYDGICPMFIVVVSPIPLRLNTPYMNGPSHSFWQVLNLRARDYWQLLIMSHIFCRLLVGDGGVLAPIFEVSTVVDRTINHMYHT